MNILKTTLLATALFAAGTASAFAAGTDTKTFNVKIVITSVCDIQTAPTDVDFGNTASTATDKTATGTVNVKCTSGTPYNIGLNAGTTAGSTVTNRRMKSATAGNTDLVPYSLYRDSGMTQNWGNTVGETLTDTGTGAVQAKSVYGKVPSANFRADSYSDVVTATVTW